MKYLEIKLAAALLVVGAAGIAVPAWADSEALEPTPGGAGVAEETDLVGPDPLGDCLRRHGVDLPPPPRTGEDELPAPPAPPEGGEGEVVPAPLPAPPDDEDFERAAEACGHPELPPGHDPFPLSDAEIAEQRAALDKYVSCMSEHGQELGEPEVESDRIAIPLSPGAFSEEFLADERACGGLPLPPG